tara:strand:+ start:719 stop:967 length:249 start_codon:yes stop_codon:yes gene_type:complete
MSQLADRTADRIAEIFKHAGDSVTLINTDVNEDPLPTDRIRRNVKHLEGIKEYKNNAGNSIWTSEDFTSINNAITAGNAKLG